MAGVSHPDLDCSVARCRDNISVVKVDDIHCRPVAHQYPSQDNVVRCSHVPHRNCPVLEMEIEEEGEERGEERGEEKGAGEVVV